MNENQSLEDAPASLTELRQHQDFFVAKILDAAIKDDVGSMEHPMFALRAGDTSIRCYEHNGNLVRITPSVLGHATIHDKDVLIYCISQLTEAMNRGDLSVGRTVRATAYDLLISTRRGFSGRSYQELQLSIERLRGTSVYTNIKSGGTVKKSWFGLIDRAQVVEKSQVDGRMVAVDITLSEWLFDTVKAREVLTLHRDYFRLRKPLERRVYELARKHCGAQGRWAVGLSILHKKTGSQSTLREFKRKLINIIKDQRLPEYTMMHDRVGEKIIFHGRTAKGTRARLADVVMMSSCG